LGVLFAARTPAQATAVARVVEGRILRPSADSTARPVPVAGEWIVLHRVGTDRAAPLDSVRSGPNGRFRFRYSPSGDPQALYFVSARYSGIAYFSSPLRADTVRGDDADIIVYDTTTDTSRVTVQGRHFVLSAPRGSRREIAEVFELENAGTRTVVAADSLHPVWHVTLPERAESVTVAPGDVTAAAITIRSGRAELFAPLSPGVRQVVLTYVLPFDALPLSVPVEHQVSVLEVLLEEPRASVQGGKLTAVAPGVIEGRQFARYLSQDVPGSAVLRISAPAPVSDTSGATTTLAVVVALVMLGALGAWYARRRATPPAAAGAAAPAPTEAERLIAELATLDARFEKDPAKEQRRAEYERARGDLKTRIARALAAENSPG
jgi:hypothetical protein